MVNDPELKAMSEVYNALTGLDEITRKRVVEWVLSKLSNSPSSVGLGNKRGPKPGSQRIGKKRGPKSESKQRRRGRPVGSKNKSTNTNYPQKSRRRGRPRKTPLEG